MNSSLVNGFSGSNFILKPQTQADNADDYEAVMESKMELREWSDSSWPEDNFSLESNLEDLVGHIDDHQAGTDLGFSIWQLDDQRFLGSVYLNDPSGLFDDYPGSSEIHQVAKVELRVEYWLRRGISQEFEKEFVLSVRDWLVQCGQRVVVWGSRRPMRKRRELYEFLGMSLLANLGNYDSTRTFSLHYWPEMIARKQN